MNKQIVFNFFQKLGCSEIETKIYLLLLERGDLTTLEISRQLKLPRTTIYRKLEEMKEKGLVEEVIEEYKTKARPVSLEALGKLVKEKERDVGELKDLFPQIKKNIFALSDLGQNLTKVLYFRGQEQVARMAWGALKTKDIFRGYSYRQFAELIGFRNALAFKDDWNRSGNKGREIYSDIYRKHLREKPNLDTGKWLNWEARFLPSSKLNITTQYDIYNDTIAIYNWYEGEIFGVLIRNQKVADMQKQIFDLLWEKAKPTLPQS